MTRPTDTNTEPDPNESGCGWEWDHTTRVTYEGEDGTQWECIECGAEGWEDAEPEDAARVAEGN